MTPLFFRASILITDKVLGYNEFMEMPYKDFSRLEAMILFKNKSINNGKNKAKNNEVKSKLSGLQSKQVKDLGFSKEQLEGIFNG